MGNRTIEAVSEKLLAAKRLLIIIHVSPDGDTLGSSLALGTGLESRGIACTYVCQDPPPSLYHFLPSVLKVRLPEQLAGEVFDTAVAVDVADSLRMGSAAPLFEASPHRIVIDHHGTNDAFGQVNWIASEYSAVGVQIADLLSHMEIPITKEIAMLLYTAICTDTGNFNYSNTNGQAMRTAARMVDAGVDVNDITRRIYRTRSREGVLLLSRALSTLTFHAQCSVASLSLRRKDFEETGADETMTEGIVNYGIEIEGVTTACFARETAEGIK